MFAEGVLFLKNRIASPLVDSLRSFKSKVTGLSGSPRNVAGGVALGLAFDFLPIPVISIPLSYLVARLTRCNPVAAVATVIFFKLAVPFFFTLNLLVGNALLGELPGPQVSFASASVFGPLLERLVEHGYPFLVGSLVNASLAGLTVYFLLACWLERRRCRKGA